jgi:ornithine cyclodeaminase/alanine dehydrogenase-like protein (mu-crystallin family)
MKVYDELEIRRAVDAAAAVAAVRDAFRADGQRRTTVPAVINLPIPGADGEFHVKSAFIDGVPHVAVKVASGFYRNPERGLPSGAGLMLLFDAGTGLPEALLLDNAYLTDLRTGAAGAVAAECLARESIATVGVIGSGVQARHQLACLRQVRHFSRVRCWSRTAAHAEALCAELRASGLDARAEATPDAVVRAADLLVTATPAHQPIVRREWLQPGLHVTAVGSDTPGKQELEADCLLRADLVVADREAQCAAFGELAHAPGLHLHAELGEIVAGLKPGRTRDDQITIADLTGVGFQDTAIASAAYEALAKEEETQITKTAAERLKPR